MAHLLTPFPCRGRAVCRWAPEWVDEILDAGGAFLARFFLDACTVKPYITKVKIGSVQHRGLLRLIEDDDARELPPDMVKRLRNILAMLLVAEDMAKVSGPPGWRIHQLKGDRAGTWSVSVSGNWRLTFAVESSEVRNLDLEDYH